jgi:uncharacterized protein (DUF2267 family)
MLNAGMDDRTFFREVAADLGCDERRAEGVTFVVFGELRDRLSVEERRDVAAQLSTGLKRLWSVGDVWREPNRIHRDEFVGRVRHRAVLSDDAEAERAVRAVFACLQRALGSATGCEGEAWDVWSQLPKDLKALWLDARPRAAHGSMLGQSRA